MSIPAAAPTPRSPKAADRVLVTTGLIPMIDGYWNALTHLQNTLEDIAGADGRLEYLLALRFRLLAALQLVDAALGGRDRRAEEAHQVAFVLEHGAPSLGLAPEAVITGAALDRARADAADLQAGLLRFGAAVLARLPGDIPEAQGTTGQRQVIRAMRDWSVAAAAVDEDLGFLAERLQDL